MNVQRPDFAQALDRTVIAKPVLEAIVNAEDPKRPEYRLPIRTIIELNRSYAHGLVGARERVIDLLSVALLGTSPEDVPPRSLSSALPPRKRAALSEAYLCAVLEPEEIRTLVRLDRGWRQSRGAVAERQRRLDDRHEPTTQASIHRIWLDHRVQATTFRSAATIKADAARIAFGTLGRRIVWAVLDSGIDGSHRHFRKYKNLELPVPLRHRDFQGEDDANALKDPFGHGTHVAGIIAGEFVAGADSSDPRPARARTTMRDEKGGETAYETELDRISGIAPECKLVSMRVLDDNGSADVSDIMAALCEIQRINDYGRFLHIHGVNLSVGYDFRPDWYACGQSPICVEVNRLVQSGVVVVVAAGNTGFGFHVNSKSDMVAQGVSISINDPGNAEFAITVGSTHRDMPHLYGVSYFSSKGPTGDGRLKPDLLAPGEKIISCRAEKCTKYGSGDIDDCEYVEDSGTSMAAPHVSGAIAGFLSVRQEFIGRPQSVKEIFLSSATDLKRERYLQGRGLLDLMRAIQSV